MRARIWAVVGAAAAILAAVGLAVFLVSVNDNDDPNGPFPDLYTEKPTINLAICDDPNLTREAWAVTCGGYGKQPGSDPKPTELPFGQTAATAGSTGWGSQEAGRLDITPASVIYAKPDESFIKGERDEWLVVSVKMNNVGSVPSEPAGWGGQGWTYIAPDGEQVPTAASLSVDGFNNAWQVTVQPATFQQVPKSWSIRANQRGGILQYKDGAGKLFQWRLPAGDSGPQAAAMHTGLQ